MDMVKVQVCEEGEHFNRTAYMWLRSAQVVVRPVCSEASWLMRLIVTQAWPRVICKAETLKGRVTGRVKSLAVMVGEMDVVSKPLHAPLRVGNIIVTKTEQVAGSMMMDVHLISYMLRADGLERFESSLEVVDAAPPGGKTHGPIRAVRVGSFAITWALGSELDADDQSLINNERLAKPSFAPPLMGEL